MKKTFKKIIALILTVLMLISVAPVQGFALFDKFTDVKVTGVEKFSWKLIKEEFDFLEEIGGAESDEDYRYELSCDATAVISTGETIKVEGGLGKSKNKKRTVIANAYVDIRDCEKAHKSGKNKVTAYVELTLLSSIGIALDTKTVEKTVSFTDKIVKKLTLVSGKVQAYEFDEYFESADMENLCFDITYGDGTKKRAKVKTTETGMFMFRNYTLDGADILISADYTLDKKGRLYTEFYFYDYEMRLKTEILDFPLKSIKINKVSFDDDFKEKSVTYTITGTNGKSYKKTYKFDKPIVDDMGALGMNVAMYEAGEFNGFDITIMVMESTGDEYPPQKLKDVTVSVEGYITDVKNCEGPREEATVIGELIYKITSFIEELLLMIGLGF